MKRKNILQVEIDDLAYGGDGVGHLEDGLTVFVSRGVPGDIVKVEVLKRKQNYLIGKLKEIIFPSPYRIEPACDVFEKCGGCQWQHIDYNFQLAQKQKIVKDALKRIGNLENIKVDKVKGSDFPWYYRNKAQLPFGIDEKENINAGFYQKGTHKIIFNENCFIQHQLINRIKRETMAVLNTYELSVYDEKNHQGLLRHLLIRVGVCSNQALVVFITKNENFPFQEEISKKLLQRIPELKGVLQNINKKDTNVILGNDTRKIKGQDQFVEYIGEVKFEISPDSFFQVNTLQTEKLYNFIKDFAQLKGNELVLDAFSGIGSISLYLADKAGEIVGIEKNQSAVKDARRNAEINNISNCNFIEGKVENKLPALIEKGKKPEIIILDPPRSGLNQTLIDQILSLKPKKIIFVSCNPTTLARDLNKLKSLYHIGRIQPVDMFPQTYHIETVVQLIRK